MEALITALARKHSALERLMAYLAAVIVVGMMLLTTADVVLRYVFNKPIQDSFEVSQFMMVSIVFLGIPYLQAIKGHVSVEFLTSRLPLATRDALKISGHLIGLFAFMIVTWRSAYFAWRAWETSDYTMGIIHYPLWPAKAVVPLGCGMLCVRLILDVVHDSAELLKRRRPT